MPTTYQEAPNEVAVMLAEIVSKWHPKIERAGVTFLLLFAHGKDGENALKLHGYPAAAIVNVVNLPDRVAGLPDCRIRIDGDRWPMWSDAKRQAILDHEAEHVEVQHDAKGNVKRDDVERPKLKLRPHDVEVIMKRHREASVEVQTAQALARKLVQMEVQAIIPLAAPAAAR